MNSARAARRNVTDRLSSRFASAQSPLPHPRQLHRPDWRHGRQAAGRAPPSERLSDLARHFGPRCCPKAPRRIQAALPPIAGELGRIKKYSLADYSARRWPELTAQINRYSRGQEAFTPVMTAPASPRAAQRRGVLTGPHRSTRRIHQPIQRRERYRAQFRCQRHCTRRLMPLRVRGRNPRQQRCRLASLQRPSAHRRKAAARPH